MSGSGARVRRPLEGAPASWICAGEGRIWERAVAARPRLALSSFLFPPPRRSSRVVSVLLAYPFFFFFSFSFSFS